MSLPTQGEVFTVLLEHIRKAQEASAILGHLTRDDDKLRAQGWLAISELLGRMVTQVTKLAMKKLQ